MLPIFPFLLWKFKHLSKIGLQRTTIYIYWALFQPYKASLIIFIGEETKVQRDKDQTAKKFNRIKMETWSLLILRKSQPNKGYKQTRKY